MVTIYQPNFYNRSYTSCNIEDITSKIDVLSTIDVVPSRGTSSTIEVASCNFYHITMIEVLPSK